MKYQIKHAMNETELKSMLGFAESVLVRGFDFNAWAKRLSARPELLVYAEYDGDVIGCAPAFMEDNGNITIGIVAVDARFRRQGIASALITEVERRAKKLGARLITLGSVESAEGFYEKLGYTGQLLIQSEKHTIDKLSALNPGYPVAFTNIYDGKINQLCLKLDKPDRALQGLYETALEGCHTQTMFWKTI